MCWCSHLSHFPLCLAYIIPYVTRAINFTTYFLLNWTKICPADNIPALCVIMMTNDNKTMYVLLGSLFPLGANQKEMYLENAPEAAKWHGMAAGSAQAKPSAAAKQISEQIESLRNSFAILSRKLPFCSLSWFVLSDAELDFALPLKDKWLLLHLRRSTWRRMPWDIIALIARNGAINDKYCSKSGRIAFAGMGKANPRWLDANSTPPSPIMCHTQLHHSSSALFSSSHFLFLCVPFFQSREKKEVQWRQEGRQRQALPPSTNQLPMMTSLVGLLDWLVLGTGSHLWAIWHSSKSQWIALKDVLVLSPPQNFSLKPFK